MSNFSKTAIDDLYTICRSHNISVEQIDNLLKRTPIEIFEFLVDLKNKKEAPPPPKRRLRIRMVSGDMPFDN